MESWKEMIRTIGHDIWPRRYYRLSEISDRYARLLTLIMIRMNFTLDQYHRRKIDFNPSKLIWLVASLLANLFTISFLLFSGLKWTYLKPVIDNGERVLQVKRADLLLLTMVVILICIELMALPTFSLVRTGRFHLFDVFHQFHRKLDCEFSPTQVQPIMRAYTRLSYLAMFLFVLLVSGFIILTGYGLVVTISIPDLDLPRRLLGMVFLLSLDISINHALAMMLLLVPHINTLMLVFKLKMHRCVELARKACQHPELIWHSQFNRSYVTLYREIRLGNDSAFSRYTLGMDTIINASWTLGLIFYTKQPYFSLFSYLILIVFALIYVLFQVKFFLFSYFPGKNLECYRLMCSWNSLRGQPKSTCWAKRVVIRVVAKNNFFLQTMARNKLGFTNGQLYFLTRFKFAEMLLVNVVFMLLFAKRLKL